MYITYHLSNRGQRTRSLAHKVDTYIMQFFLLERIRDKSAREKNKKPTG